MRIIGGQMRGRPLAAPRNARVRPTTDRMRETLFNLLMHGAPIDLEGARVADIFAGTGALGLEALSRGAAHVTFVDSDAASLTILNENIDRLDVRASTRVLRQDARRLGPTDTPFDLLFLDPPYARGLVAPTLAVLKAGDWFGPGSVVVIETEAELDPSCDSLTLLKERVMGQARIGIFEVTG